MSSLLAVFYSFVFQWVGMCRLSIRTFYLQLQVRTAAAFAGLIPQYMLTQ